MILPPKTIRPLSWLAATCFFLIPLPAEAQEAAGGDPAAEPPDAAQLIEEQQEQRAALRALELPQDAASKHCSIIDGSTSPDGRYAFAYGTLPEGSKSAAKMATEATGPALEITCLVDVKADRILSMSSVTHSGPKDTYNHNTHTAVWAPDSTLVIQLAGGKWETLQGEAFRIADGKAVWLTDFLENLKGAVAEAAPKEDGVPTVTAKIAKDGVVSGTSSYVNPRGEEDERKFTFTGQFASDGSFASVIKGPGTTGNGKPFAKLPALKWKITETEKEGQPKTTVKLLANGKSAAFASGSKLAEIPRKSWPDQKIPEDAILAAGGWWAGGGEYYYLKYDKGILTAYRAIVEEGGPAEPEFFAFKYFTPSDFK